MSEQPSSWAVGYTAFAGVMLILIGFFHFFTGLVAVANDEFFVKGAEWTFKFDITTWGWIHLVVGVVVAAAGLGVFFGNVLARTVGVFVAALSAVANSRGCPGTRSGRSSSSRSTWRSSGR